MILYKSKINNLLFIFFVILFLFNKNINSVICIFTYIHKPNNLLEIQYKLLKKFLKDEFKFIVFNDSNDPEITTTINDVCNKYNLTCINIPQELHFCAWQTLSLFIKNHDRLKYFFRYGQFIKYAFDTIGFKHDDIIVLMNSNILLTKSFSIREYISDNGLCGKKIECNRLTPVPDIDLVFFNIPKLININSMIFEASIIGHYFKRPLFLLDYYLYSHPQVKIKWFNNKSISSIINNLETLKYNFTDEQINFINGYNKIFIDSNISFDKDNSEFFENSFFNFKNEPVTDIIEQQKKAFVKFYLTILSV